MRRSIGLSVVQCLPAAAVMLLCCAAAHVQAAGLPRGFTSQDRKLAVLHWLADQITVAQRHGDSKNVAALQRDVAALQQAAIGDAHTASSRLLPHVPDIAVNPIARFLFWHLKQILKAPHQHYAYASEPRSWQRPLQTCYEGLDLAEAFCQPQSPYYGDPALIGPMFNRFDYIYRTHQAGDSDLANFGYSPALTEMYLLLDSTFPSLIPPSRKALWQASILANSRAIRHADLYTRADVQTRYAAAKPFTAYPNADVKYIISLLYAARLFQHHGFAKLADAGLAFLHKRAIYPDGGYTYINSQDECYTYHEIDVLEIARAWQLTGSPIALSLLKMGRNYYPLSIEPMNVAEYYTAPCWKHYWNAVHGALPALIEAVINKSRQNMRVAMMNPLHGDLIQAAWWRPGLFSPAPAPDNYFVYDRNIQGPRGRFGAFSFAGVGRHIVAGDIGTSTFVGAMAGYAPGLQPGRGMWAANAAMEDVAGEVCINSTPNACDSQHYHHYACLAVQAHTTTITARGFAALASTYRLAPYGKAPLAWRGCQEWIFLPDQMIGLVRITSLANQRALGTDATLVMISSGLNTRQVKRSFKPMGTHRWRFGSLMVHVLASNYSRVQFNRTSTFVPDRNSAVRMRLFNRAVAASGRLYKRGASRYALLSVRPVWNKSPIESVQRRVVDGVTELQLPAMLLLHNPTRRSITLHMAAPWSGPIYLHTDAEQFRPSWIAAQHQAHYIHAAEQISRAQIRSGLTVAPYSSIVLTRTPAN
ncbi:MAG: hypothetical protein ACP5QA_11655 [Phycisphaerae bacterium]